MRFFSMLVLILLMAFPALSSARRAKHVRCVAKASKYYKGVAEGRRGYGVMTQARQNCVDNVRRIFHRKIHYAAAKYNYRRARKLRVYRNKLVYRCKTRKRNCVRIRR